MKNKKGRSRRVRNERDSNLLSGSKRIEKSRGEAKYKKLSVQLKKKCEVWTRSFHVVWDVDSEWNLGIIHGVPQLNNDKTC